MAIHKCSAKVLPRCDVELSKVNDGRYQRCPKSCIAILVVIVGLAYWPHDAATAQTNFAHDLLTKITPSVREALSHLQERPSLYALGMSETDLGGKPPVTWRRIVVVPAPCGCSTVDSRG
jgi:hypothetical protein